MSKLDLACIMETRVYDYPDDDALNVFCKRVHFTVLPDRFGYLNKFTSWKMSDYTQRFPVSSCTNRIDDIIDNRAQEIIDLARTEQKDMYVLFSGGVDSTTVLLSMMKVLDGAFNNLYVVYTQSSILENPVLFEYLQKSGVNLVFVDGASLPNKCYELSRNNYVITGFPADQLFGSIINQSHPEEFFCDWRKFVVVDKAIQQFEEAFSYYGLPIKTQGEFLWFMNFACKWEIVKYFFPCLTGMDNGMTINFFDTTEFQDWSVSNFDRLFVYSQTDTKHYKEDLKSYIYRIFPDDDYRYNKGKIGSVGNAVRHTEVPLSGMCTPVIATIEDGKFKQYYYHTTCHVSECNKIRQAMMRRVLQPFRVLV